MSDDRQTRFAADFFANHLPTNNESLAVSDYGLCCNLIL